MRGLFAVVLLSLAVSACESIEYGVKEKFGIEKRDILVARVTDAMTAQEAAKNQFRSALEEFSAVVAFDGGDLEELYDDLKDALDDSEERAEVVTARIDDVERVSSALFDEWRRELHDYTSSELQRASAAKLKSTEARYAELMKSMRRAESRMGPVLDAFRDQALYLKHNLNARAISALKGELRNIESDVGRLVRDMEASIGRSRAFIKEIEAG